MERTRLAQEYIAKGNTALAMQYVSSGLKISPHSLLLSKLKIQVSSCAAWRGEGAVSGPRRFCWTTRSTTRRMR